MIGAVMVAAGSGWCLYFAQADLWPHAATQAILALVGCWVIVKARQGHFRNATLIVLIGLFCILWVMLVFVDIPTPKAPRALHHFFLAMGVGSFMLLKREPLWLRHGMPLLCFVAFYVFARMSLSIDTPLALPDAVRVPAGWVHNAIALSIMYVLLCLMLSDVDEHKAMSASLRKGLYENQFSLHYQPQLGEDGRICGAEALLRWRHPNKGMVSPVEFIPVAENTGFILPLGHWVLGTACAQLVAWAKEPATEHLSVAVNVSAQQFRQVDYVAQVLSVLERTGANPNRLKLELTESMLLNDVDDIIAKMTELRANGVRLSLDDFGAGYSSLSYLKRLPLDQIKIDKSFVNDVMTKRKDAAIARAIVKLAQEMELDVIAEGVETQGQRDFLAGIGCLAIQGYLVSRALPIREFDAFIASFSRTTHVAA